MQSYRLPWTAELNTEEIVTLIHATNLSLLNLIPQERRIIGRATSKLLCKMGEKNRIEICDLLKSCEHNFENFDLAHSQLEILSVIFQAIRTECNIRIEYIEGTSSIVTKITRLRVVASECQWWLIGRSSVHRKNLTLDILEIQKAEKIDERFSSLPRHSQNKKLNAF